jgi:hypothetical protein
VLLALPDVFQHCPSQTRIRVDESSIKLSFAFYLASTLIDSLARMAWFLYSGYFLMSCFVHNRFEKNSLVTGLKIKKEHIKKDLCTCNLKHEDITNTSKHAGNEAIGDLGAKVQYTINSIHLQ